MDSRRWWMWIATGTSILCELQVGDVDRDGDIDICSKPWGPRAWNGNGGKMHVDFFENLQKP